MSVGVVILLLALLFLASLILYMLHIRPQPLQPYQSPTEGGADCQEETKIQAHNDVGDETAQRDRGSAGVRGFGWSPETEPDSPPQKPPGTDSEAFEEDLVGEVRDFHERTETKPGLGHGSETIWTFRLERYRDGHRLAPIAVEIRGKSMSGSISNGDTVRVRGAAAGLVRTRRVYNVTIGDWVGRRGWF